MNCGHPSVCQPAVVHLVVFRYIQFSFYFLTWQLLETPYCWIGYLSLSWVCNCSLTPSLKFAQVLHLVEQLCLALNDEFRTHLPDILSRCIQVLSDAERCNDYTYVRDILHTLEVFGGKCCLFR